MRKYIFCTGGVFRNRQRGHGGLSRAGAKARRFRVSIQKLDPYINVDRAQCRPTSTARSLSPRMAPRPTWTWGTMSGSSTSTSPALQRDHRPGLCRGDRQGAARRLSGRHDPGHPAHHQRDQVPHRPGGARDGADVVIVEIGGTVGDIESLPFLEAHPPDAQGRGAREHALHPRDLAALHCRHAANSKPSPPSTASKSCARIGIQPDVIVCRSDYPVGDEIKTKIALFCDVERAGRDPVDDRGQHLQGAPDAGRGGPGQYCRRAAGPGRAASRT